MAKARTIMVRALSLSWTRLSSAFDLIQLEPRPLLRGAMWPPAFAK